MRGDILTSGHTKNHINVSFERIDDGNLSFVVEQKDGDGISLGIELINKNALNITLQCVVCENQNNTEEETNDEEKV